MLNCVGIIASFANTTNYVDNANTGYRDGPPYNSWPHAATNIQDALNKSANGDLVLVTNGVYNFGGLTNWPAGCTLTNRVVISNAVTVQAVSTNPAVTIIQGAADPASTSGPAAVRCVYMANNSVLIGFTLTNGYTRETTGGNWGLGATNGGGVYASSSSSVLSNCVIVACKASYQGGGGYNGTYYNCMIDNNTSGLGGGGIYNNSLSVGSRIRNNFAGGNGGGVYGGILSNCLISGNTASNTLSTNGGGGESCTLAGCTVSNNYCSNSGGGTDTSSATDSLFINNRCGNAGSATISSTGSTRCRFINNYGGSFVTDKSVINCLFTGNDTTAIRDAAGSCMVNCTIVSNTLGIGGAIFASVSNCIIYGNISYDVKDLSVESNCYYSCIGSNSAGTNHVANRGNVYNASPQFVDTSAGNYHLSGNSPCIDTGTNINWTSSDVDLDGQPRLRYGRVDMGCYELLHKITIFTIQGRH